MYVKNKLRLNTMFFYKVIFVLIPFSGYNSPVRHLFWAILLISFFKSFLLLIRQLRRDDTVKYYSGLSLSVLLALTLISFYTALIGVGEFIDTMLVVGCLLNALVVPLSVKSKADRKNFAIFLLRLALVHLIYAILQIVMGYDPIWGNTLAGGRPTGLFSWGAPVVGSFIGICLFAYYILEVEDQNRYKLFYVILLLGTILGGNRSMFVMHIFAIFIVMFSTIRVKKVIYRLTILSVISVILVTNFNSLILFMSDQLNLSNNLINRVISLSGNIIEEQQSKRIATWFQTLCMIEERPFLGYGIGKFELHFAQFLDCALNSEGIMPHPHNFLLDIFITFGIFGGGALIALIWLLQLLSTIKQRNTSRFPLIIMLTLTSPLNLSHGLASLWFASMLFIIIGLSISMDGSRNVKKTISD